MSDIFWYYCPIFLSRLHIVSSCLISMLHHHGWSLQIFCHVWPSCLISYDCHVSSSYMISSSSFLIFLTDLHAWTSCLTFMSDFFFVWFPCLIFISDIFWSNCLIFLLKLHVWSLFLNFLPDLFVWSFCLFYMNDFHILYFCLIFLFDVFIWSCLIQRFQRLILRSLIYFPEAVLQFDSTGQKTFKFCRNNGYTLQKSV